MIDIPTTVDRVIDNLHEAHTRGPKRAYLHRVLLDTWRIGYQSGFDAASRQFEIEEFVPVRELHEDRLREVIEENFNKGDRFSDALWEELREEILRDAR